jgi:uncharacterized protein (DUF58 family)
VSKGLAPSPVAAVGRSAHRMPLGVTPRGFMLLAAGLFLILPAWLDRRVLTALILWDIIVVVLLWVDARALPAPSRLRVTRSWNSALVLGSDAQVTLAVSTDSDVPVRVRLTDHVPPLLRRDAPAFEQTAVSGVEASGQYVVHPRERGDLAVDLVTLQYRSGWELATRWAVASLPQTVRVYPDVRQARQHSLYLIRSRQTMLEKRRARRYGTGREFESLRDHQLSDEPRDICWTAAARRGRLVTKVYQPERSQAVWILIDSGRLLRARVGQRSKLDHTVDAALALAHVAMASGDRVGLLTYGRRVKQCLAPSRGALHTRSLLEALAVVHGESVEADHTAAASRLLASQKRRALIVWLTDVAETAGVPDVIESAAHMTARHLVLFAVMRHVPLTQLAASTPDRPLEMYRVMAAQETLDRRDALLGALRQRGALAVELAPHELTSRVIDRYLAIKERGAL